MDYSFYLDKNTPDEGLLLRYGFVREGSALVLRRELRQRGLYAAIKISDNNIDVRVIDRAFDDDFIPFGIKDGARPEKAEVESILADIVDKCFICTDVKDRLIRYLYEKYGTTPERPWDTYPDYCTFKAAGSKKWYAIIMDVRRRSIAGEGDDKVEIVNVKVCPERLALIDGERYFAAYHMNKKTWLTVLLDRHTDTDMLKELIDESYRLVEKK